jgi:hypothetical protein
MGFTYIDTLTGSLDADNKAAIKMDIPIGNDSSAAGTKYFELQYEGDAIFYITKEGHVHGNQFVGPVVGTTTTSSYLLQTTQNKTKGLGYFDGTRLKSADGLVFDNNDGGVKSLSISSSLSRNFLNIASRGTTSGVTKYNQAGIGLFNYNSNEPYPTYDSWTLMSATSGSLTFVSPIGSNAFSSSTIKAQSTTGECYAMVQRRNGFYFWPYMTSNSPARDGAIGIGVQPPEEATGSFSKYLRAKLQINMFSGSGEGPWTPQATVEHRSTAILVNYGSGSATTTFTPTFYVSASGKTYIGGPLQINGGVRLNSPSYLPITTRGQSVSINASNVNTQFIQLSNHGTASITMSTGQPLNIVVNQAAATHYTASLLFKGATLSGSVYPSPIVWRNGTQPKIITGSANRADFFTFVGVNTSTLGPKGAGAVNYMVIYGTSVQNMY